jgi:hypothetical protein
VALAVATAAGPAADQAGYREGGFFTGEQAKRITNALMVERPDPVEEASNFAFSSSTTTVS